VPSLTFSGTVIVTGALAVERQLHPEAVALDRQAQQSVAGSWEEATGWNPEVSSTVRNGLGVWIGLRQRAEAEILNSDQGTCPFFRIATSFSYRGGR